MALSRLKITLGPQALFFRTASLFAAWSRWESDWQIQSGPSASPDIPKWSALLVEAVNKPGLIMDAYYMDGFIS
jgi:hypothetical protein